MSDYRPIAIEDIKSSLLYENKEGRIYCIGSISRDKYIKVPEDILEYVMAFIKYLDGTNTLEQIQHKLNTVEKIELDVEYLLSELEKADLIVNNPNTDKVEKSEFERFFLKLVDIPLGKYSKAIKNIDKTLVHWMFGVSVVAILLGICFFFIQIEKFVVLDNYKLNESLGVSIFVSLPILLISIVLHESAHAMVASYYGLTPSNLVFGFYANLSSMFYLKIPGIYTLTKKEKLVVWSAGIYTNLLLSAISVLFAAFGEGTVLTIANLCMVMNLSFVFCNLSPLLPLDGYYLLSTIINQPNLRKNSFGMFKDIIKGKGTIRFKCLYILYFLCCISFMVAVSYIQLKYVMIWFAEQYKIHGSVIDIIANSKLIMVILVLICIKLGVAIVKKIVRSCKGLNKTVRGE
ncbi:MAG: hypothetical protein IJP29_04340 [Lachnospiraceae bacterium]|nr:hypothetical protein [Lachnospiraceae bacterium]